MDIEIKPSGRDFKGISKHGREGGVGHIRLRQNAARHDPQGVETVLEGFEVVRLELNPKSGVPHVLHLEMFGFAVVGQIILDHIRKSVLSCICQVAKILKILETTRRQNILHYYEVGYFILGGFEYYILIQSHPQILGRTVSGIDGLLGI